MISDRRLFLVTKLPVIGSFGGWKTRVVVEENFERMFFKFSMLLICYYFNRVFFYFLWNFFEFDHNHNKLLSKDILTFSSHRQDRFPFYGKYFFLVILARIDYIFFLRFLLSRSSFNVQLVAVL